ncbi:hypothetical protein EVAR_33982_1 [Eumeta japonica]|uniref:Secreted protein n=1 Tax=Eumeta variegata TaxID=151549 RepID=A0A4C1X3V1_EUMVA|nr:hypothetical protein EVAR_33982_1 [Eumeta japonica]
MPTRMLCTIIDCILSCSTGVVQTVEARRAPYKRECQSSATAASNMATLSLDVLGKNAKETPPEMCSTQLCAPSTNAWGGNSPRGRIGIGKGNRPPRATSATIQQERPIRRTEFRQIKSKRLGSQNLFSIRSMTVETAMLFSCVDSEPYRNGRRYLAPVNDYCQWSAALSS